MATASAYATRRRAQGKTNREIKRRLIRYIARQLYRLLEAQPPQLTQHRSVRLPCFRRSDTSWCIVAGDVAVLAGYWRLGRHKVLLVASNW